MTHNYVDLATVHDPVTGTVAPAAWGDAIRDNFELLIDPPACSVFHSTTTSVPNLTTTVLPANSENFDNDSMHSTVTNTSRITAQTAGRYLAIATVTYASGTGRRITSFRLDGTTVITGAAITSDGSSSDRISIVRSVILTVGQYLETTANQNNGTALDVTLDEFVLLYLTR